MQAGHCCKAPAASARSGKSTLHRTRLHPTSGAASPSREPTAQARLRPRRAPTTQARPRPPSGRMRGAGPSDRMRARGWSRGRARLAAGGPKPMRKSESAAAAAPTGPDGASISRTSPPPKSPQVTGCHGAGQGPKRLSRRMGQKKQRLTEAELHQSPPDTAQMPSPKEPHLRPTSAPGPQRSIYFSSLGHPARLGTEFFDQPAIPLARAFLGQVLVRRLADGTELRGRIVETEAYLGPEDEAAHSRGGRQTPRNRGMFMKPGTLYVYIIYGMYFCMNVSSQGDGACVLLRALEPLGGLETMRRLRSNIRKGTLSRTLKDRELCNGPSKLCQALAIDKSFDQRDLAQDEAMWLECGLPGPRPAVVAAARVGIGYAGEWAQKPLRFYFQGSPWVSVVDRTAEQDTQT